MTTPALRGLRREFPDATIDFLVGRWSAGVLENNPHINERIIVPDEIFFQKKIWKLVKCVRNLRRRQYDMAVVFQPAKSMKYLLKLAGIPLIAALSSAPDRESITYPVPWRADRNRYVGDDFFDVVRPLGAVSDGRGMEYHCSDADLKRVEDTINTLGIDPTRLIIVCPGGARNPRDYVAQKIWPETSYIDLMSRLIHHEFSVMIAGTETDRQSLGEILSLEKVIDMVGKTTIQALAGWISRARLVITNDSFPLHLALAMDTPVVPIFGPSRASALLPETGRYIKVESPIRCAPCYDNEPFPGCPRFHCIHAVETDQVFRCVEEALNRW